MDWAADISPTTDARYLARRHWAIIRKTVVTDIDDFLFLLRQSRTAPLPDPVSEFSDFGFDTNRSTHHLPAPTAGVQINVEPDSGRTPEPSAREGELGKSLHSLGSSLLRRPSESPSLLSASFSSTGPQSPGADDDVKSQISFVMRERLHSFVKQHANPGKTAEFDVADRVTGKFHLGWLFAVTTAFLYNALGIPLRSSYPYQTDANVVYWLIVDYLCDAIYLADMIIIKPRLQFMRGGISIGNRRDTLRNYVMSGSFKLDLLSIVPLDFMYFYTDIIPIWRLGRLLKVQSFWQLFDLLDNSFSNPYVIRITRTLSYMVYIIHCNSCVYYLLSAWQAFGQIAYQMNGKYYLNKWVYNNKGNAYLRCFYFTAAVATSTGNNPAPTNVIEYIYMTFSWMMGVFVFALLLGQIRDIVSNANRNRAEYQRQMDMALSECKKLNLSRDLVERVRDWFIYTWEQHKTLDEKKLIEKLPLKLQTDLALSVHYNTLSKVKLFQDCDRAFLRDLVLKLRPVIYLPGDLVCKKGDVGKEMYIVNQGVLEVVGGNNNETVFAQLQQGSVFGEISLLAIGGNNRRTANIRAKGYATLFVLAKEDLNDVIRYYPQAQMLLKRKAAQMLKNDKKDDESKDEKPLEDTCRISGKFFRAF
ncbi:unnamed protein product, partial [Mesorhabditis spiculigera]